VEHAVTILAALMVPFTLLLLAVAIELGARWWIRHRTPYFVLPPGLRLRLEPDPAVLPQLERSVRFDVNSDGERGDDVPRSRDGLFRVLVAGGSQPEGYLLDQDTAWPGALHRLLQEPEHLKRLGVSRAHVGNIARSGVGSQALDLILGRVLPRYSRLQAIIILVGASDVLHWLETGAPPSAPPPASTSDVFRCHPELSFGWTMNRLAVVELLLRLRQRWLRPVQVHANTCRWIAKARSMRARATEIRSDVPDPSPMLAHFDEHFRSALRRAKAHADRVIVVRQPWFDKHCTPEEAALMWHGGVGQAWRENVSTFYSCEVLSRLMALLDARAARAAHELGIEQVDLMPVVEPSVKTYYDFFHATPAGSRTIAEAVAAVVLRLPRREPIGSPPALVSLDLVDCDSEELRQKVS
jgi:lysophospholipase L1-like esterase